MNCPFKLGLAAASSAHFTSDVVHAFFRSLSTTQNKRCAQRQWRFVQSLLSGMFPLLLRFSPCVPATHLCLQEDVVLRSDPVESHSKPSLPSHPKRMGPPQPQFPVKKGEMCLHLEKAVVLPADLPGRVSVFHLWCHSKPLRRLFLRFSENAEAFSAAVISRL